MTLWYQIVARDDVSLLGSAWGSSTSFQAWLNHFKIYKQLMKFGPRIKDFEKWGIKPKKGSTVNEEYSSYNLKSFNRFGLKTPHPFIPSSETLNLVPDQLTWTYCICQLWQKTRGCCKYFYCHLSPNMNLDAKSKHEIFGYSKKKRQRLRLVWNAGIFRAILY